MGHSDCLRRGVLLQNVLNGPGFDPGWSREQCNYSQRASRTECDRQTDRRQTTDDGRTGKLEWPLHNSPKGQKYDDFQKRDFQNSLIFHRQAKHFFLPARISIK